MFTFSLLAIITNLFSPQAQDLPTAIPLINWHEASIFQLPTQKDQEVEAIVDRYLDTVVRSGFPRNSQGIWIQSDWATLADNEGKIPVSAASITKVATTIAAIEKWGLDYRFLTRVYGKGKLQNGVWEGDLIIVSEGDPLFVWEEAIAMANRLEERGIKKITGDLLIVGDWQMNYKEDAFISAQMLRKAIDSNQWNYRISRQYEKIEPKIPKPTLKIEGNTILNAKLPENSQLLLTHQSLNIAEILKLMNVYSNNKVAEALANKIGGGEKVAEIASSLAIVPQSEINLINGSGLGVDNRISPRAACRMFIALERQLKNTDMNIGDLFPVAGVGLQGTIQNRKIPLGVPVKTGTLNSVSALAGVIVTEERERVWFAIINSGWDIHGLRRKQDVLLNDLANHWQFKPLHPQITETSYFGDPSRNL